MKFTPSTAVSSRLLDDDSVTSVRGVASTSPIRYGHRSFESMGGNPAAAAAASVASTPASPQKVANQSLVCVRPSRVAPRAASGTAPPPTSARTCTPPCQSENLAPRSGKLEAAKPLPPLSEAKTMSVSAYMLALSVSAVTSLPTASSRNVTIPRYFCRGAQLGSPGSPSSYSAVYSAGTSSGVCGCCSATYMKSGAAAGSCAAMYSTALSTYSLPM
mmetsp:Transcript_24934/g.86851  ORF Transcript_24934/g.86851 Transcript_24934/m.86851 type:complete len:217 (-) Transcript_24934:650-1300(-)